MKKILLMYPTLIKAGLAISHYMMPDPFLSCHSLPTTTSFYVTAVTCYFENKKYKTEVDILFEKQSVLQNYSNDNNSVDHFMFSQVDDNTISVGSAFKIMNVPINKPGAYEIRLRIYEDIGDDKLSEFIDEKTCSFIATYNERSNN